MNRIQIPTTVKENVKSIKTPMYELVNGGTTILVKNPKGGYLKSLNVHHISPIGVMCDDLETFIEWDKF